MKKKKNVQLQTRVLSPLLLTGIRALLTGLTFCSVWRGGSLGSRLCNGIRVREDYWGALLGTAPGRREGSETGQRDEWNRPVVSAPFAQGP